jgi:hypothetical protein
LRKNLIPLDGNGEEGKAIVVEGSLLMKYFYAIIKKNYKMRQSKERASDPNYEGGKRWGGRKALKEQKHSWCSELPSFFISL